MKINISPINFKRLLTPLEKIETRIYSQEAKKALGIDDLAMITHSVSFPSTPDEDIGLGLLTLNKGSASYIDFLYNNAFDTLSIEPNGIIKPETYSPYESSLSSKKQVVDLKLLCNDEWANIFDINSYNEIVKNKNYSVKTTQSPNSEEVEFTPDMALYDYVMDAQKIAIQKAYANFKTKVENNDKKALEINEEFENYKKENDYYLKNDSIYAILSNLNDGKNFANWDNKLHQTLFDFSDLTYTKEEKEAEIEHLESKYSKEIDLYKFIQFVVFKQQKDFVNYASKISGIRYEQDVETVRKAYDEGKISEEKYRYLTSKLIKYNNKSVNIIGDKQVGYSDMDIFSNPSIFTKDEFMGAAPNITKSSPGQDWGFRFISYEKLFNKDGSLASGGEYLKKAFKKAFEDNSGGLRIDHIIGLIDPWTYKINDKKINSEKFDLFLNTNLKELTECGITNEKISGFKDIEGAIKGTNKEEHEKLAKNKDIDFIRANKILDKNKELISKIANFDAPMGSRHIFKYLLNHNLAELKNYNLNERTISGIIDPMKAIFNKESLERSFLVQRGVKDFDKIKEIITEKKDEIFEIYSGIIEKIILGAAYEVVEENFKKKNMSYDENDIKQKALSLLMCEDLGSTTLPVKQVLKKYNLSGMRDAARSNPYDENNIYREINPLQCGNYWLVSTHDTKPYKQIFEKFDDKLKQAHIDYVASEMNLNPDKLSSKNNIWNYVKAKVGRIFLGDKNPKTSNRVILNWLDIFASNKQYNTPGLHDRTKNWVLRICGSNENFEKKYYEEILPSRKGINVAQSLSLALKANNQDKNLQKELDRLSSIAQE